MIAAVLAVGVLLQFTPPWALFTQTSSGGAPDFTLPDANQNEGRVIMVKVLPTASATTVRAPTNQLIDNLPTYTVAVGGSASFQSESGSWRLVTTFDPGGGGGAPANAEFVTYAANASLSAERVLSNGLNSVIDLGTAGQAQVDVQAYTMVQDESTDLVQRSTLQFTGAGVTCADSGGVTSCDIPGGSGSGNSVEVSLAISGGAGYYSTTVTGQAWVAAGSEIVCAPFGTTADGGTVELTSIAGFVVTTSDRVVGTGFNLNVYSPYGATGTFRFHCLGT